MDLLYPKEIRELIFSRHGNTFSIAYKSLLQLGSSLQFSFTNSNREVLNNYPKQISSVLLSKSNITLNAALETLYSGYYAPTNILLRSVFENTLVVRKANIDPEYAKHWVKKKPQVNISELLKDRSVIANENRDSYLKIWRILCKDHHPQKANFNRFVKKINEEQSFINISAHYDEFQFQECVRLLLHLTKLSLFLVEESFAEEMNKVLVAQIENYLLIIQGEINNLTKKYYGYC